MTNPDNVGGLPKLPAWMSDYTIPNDAFEVGKDVRLSDRMRAYGELCRAAPAGGDDFAERLWEALSPDDCPKLTRRKLKAALKAANSGDSAPAGSGEILTEHGVKALDRCCGELRKFIELAGDYDLDEMSVQALETAIESMELRKSAALLRKLQQGADYVMVPREPTSKMAALGAIAHKERGMAAAYRAMIAASQGQDGGKA